MLVQDRTVPNSPKSQIRQQLPTINHHRFSESKSLDFSTWVSENLYKIIVVLLLVTTIAALFVLRSSSDAASLLQSQSQQHSPSSISLPVIKWNSITPITDRSSDQGMASACDGEFEDSKDWSLKGAIYLSLDMQASLGFRVLDFLPYDSYVRKTCGYLFAIQHGAKKIFDADDREEVIGDDLAKHFDVELVGEAARQETILQFSHENPNRTVVNPYVHFGQRSVWPRGFAIGKCRKSGLEPFDIRFDDHAPKVALPQGMMVPVNSFNTIYQSSAFWALMLPVSVSTMASDVLRGYWGQRLLWEIGGYVVVYPPTVHRYDKIEAYPFSEEKDLHVNVGRLIKFLNSWRSNKHRLFEKILELSHAMAEEGFWTEKDVKFTAAWLQDLLAVGYQQPRLMSLELDRPRATIGHGDRKEFIPRKLPSVHLAVEETGTVSYEIGNLIRWRKNFGNVVLIMFCSGPVERTALEWRLLYGRIFKTVVILSEQKNEDLAVQAGQLDQVYRHFPKIFDRYSSADGFLFLQDDTILNYWNLMQADKNKLWITDKVSKSWTTVSTNGNSDWYLKQAEMVKKVVSTMPAHFQVNYKEAVRSEQTLIICNSEIFYIPQHFAADFVDLVNLVGNLEMHYKVAIPMFFLSMDSQQNFDSLLSTMIYKRKQPSANSTTLYSAQAPAVHPWSVSSEQEFIKLIRVMAEGDPLLMELF
ncbi:hypothetical protein JRO89_XS11G0076000 [Xanthoceras sorbifolium]|uniref:Glycosyltransferase STELLO1 n=1 Tax=Xanthoceras sorbifolium TaxID=99658 RepID=A0ABQ8HF01_9ROSI|nr:hypothetical protein JRO89_XS11G0076000 [Xanthoceras sorbifolium]